jgi:hypothetical protein
MPRGADEEVSALRATQHHCIGKGVIECDRFDDFSTFAHAQYCGSASAILWIRKPYSAFRIKSDAVRMHVFRQRGPNSLVR